MPFFKSKVQTFGTILTKTKKERESLKRHCSFFFIQFFFAYRFKVLFVYVLLFTRECSKINSNKIYCPPLSMDFTSKGNISVVLCVYLRSLKDNKVLHRRNIVSNSSRIFSTLVLLNRGTILNIFDKAGFLCK